MGERPTKAPQEIVTESSDGITRMSVDDGNWSFGSPNFYLIQGIGRAVIVDSGTGSLPEYDLFEKTWVDKRRPTVEAVIVTHYHFDHNGGSSAFAKLVGAEVIGGREKEEVEQAIQLGEREVVILPTPGHTKDSLCVLDRNTNALFTGDTVIEDKSVVVDDMREYTGSLEKLKKIKPTAIFPGHGNYIPDAGQKINEYIARTHRRERMIIRFIKHGLNSVDSLTKRMYPHKPKAGQKQVMSHVKKLIDDGRLVESKGQLTLI
jgi:glyoxylase-like metal-dependent hydrolase (beta-lactamase superfamily II)